MRNAALPWPCLERLFLGALPEVGGTWLPKLQADRILYMLREISVGAAGRAVLVTFPD